MGRRLILEADGGSRGNPGVAGYGALLREAEHGRLLAQRAAPLGTASNNVAEYSGLIAGLQAVIDLDQAADVDLVARMDSKLVIEQMAGRWKIKHPEMRRLALQAQDLVRQIQQVGGRVHFEWIPRARNGAADALSNKGMDQEHIWVDSFPAEDDDGPSPVEEVAVSAHETSSTHETPSANAVAAQPRVAASPATKATAPESGLDPAFGDARAPVSVAAAAISGRPPAMTDPVRIILVRHGVTDYTLASKLDGRGGADPALHATGEAQAQAAATAVAARLDTAAGPVQVVTSSLRRAQQTGAAIAEVLNVEPTHDPDWDEQSFGDWDGAALPDLARTSYDDLLALRVDIDYARPGGESHRQLAQRVEMAFARAIERGGTVVVATHRKPLMCVLAQVLSIDHERIWSVSTAPCSLTQVDVWPDGGVSVSYVNDTHHLQGIA